MPSKFGRMSRWGFAVAIAAGLTFGGQSALAAPVSGWPCEVDPEHGLPGLSCQTNRDCEGVCWYSGMWVDGICGFDKCCQCPW